MKTPRPPLCATARLQFHAGFTLDDGAALVPYFAGLGISHLYASPLLPARSGSTHGYDIFSHTGINLELGGMPALQRLASVLHAHGMGLILDIVPNHMGVGGGSAQGANNDWWLDVLEWGRASLYAGYFDIDWDPPDPALRGRVLAPFLGSAYGICLQNAELVLQFSQTDGRLYVDYYGNRFPIAPGHYATVLGRELGAGFVGLGNGRPARAEAAAARAALRDPAHGPAIAQALAAYAPDTPAGQARLHRLLERQHYRLAWWRAAADEINWRRFFDVNGLAGIRPEVPAVFDATHDFILHLLADGLIDGLRIDHVDGLAEPRAYCRKLRRRVQALCGQQAADIPIWIEKILAPHENLPNDWLVDGTTGYDFMNEVGGLFHDPQNEAELGALWHRLTGRPTAFEEEERPARRQILRDSLASELLATAVALHRIAGRNLQTRDWTLTIIHRALTEILVHFPVYRIYAGLGGMADADARVMDWAMAGARRQIRRADLDLLELVRGWLAGEGLRQMPPGPRRRERLRAMVRFQQLSAPTAAKSVEDTAFYRYGRLISRNEVGSNPGQFSLSKAAFHNANAARRRHFPQALLATATHDHKRGEDARLRLAVISEIPAEWEAALARWTRLNAALKQDVEGPAPDAVDEIMLYQTLVGAWPLNLDPEDAAGLDSLIGRVQEWQEKALRESKRRSGWAAPNTAYEAACRDFVAAILAPGRAAAMARDIAAFAARIALPGAVGSLSQTLLRLTCPGIPDLYQGTEFWDFSLVDPDNRRPVDFAARAAALAAAAPPADALAHWRDGRVKQAVITRALALRARPPDLFRHGQYQKLSIEGSQAEHSLAFLRFYQGKAVLVVVSRLVAQLPMREDQPLVEPAAWADTAVMLPRAWRGRRWKDALAGPAAADKDDVMTFAGNRMELRLLLCHLPVALLELQ